MMLPFLKVVSNPSSCVSPQINDILGSLSKKHQLGSRDHSEEGKAITESMSQSSRCTSRNCGYFLGHTWGLGCSIISMSPSIRRLNLIQGSELVGEISCQIRCEEREERDGKGKGASRGIYLLSGHKVFLWIWVPLKWEEDNPHWNLALNFRLALPIPTTWNSS